MGWETQSNSIINTADTQNWYEGSKGNGFLTGGVLTSADVDRETDYTAFTAIVNGTLVVVAASSVTHDAGDATNPRIDIVEVNSSGTVAIVKGTATAENSTTQPRPPAPTLTAGSLMLAAVYVPASASTILDANIFDRRVERNDATTVSAIPRCHGDICCARRLQEDVVGTSREDDGRPQRRSDMAGARNCGCRSVDVAGLTVLGEDREVHRSCRAGSRGSERNLRDGDLSIEHDRTARTHGVGSHLIRGCRVAQGGEGARDE